MVQIHNRKLIIKILAHLLENIVAAVSVLDTRCLYSYGYALLANIWPIVSCWSLAPADIAFIKKHSLLEVKSIGGQIILKHPDFSLVRELYGRNIYFPQIGFIPTPGSKVVDLGANVGLFSLLCAKLGAKVLAVEAQSGFITIARNNFALNGVENRIQLIHAMVGGSTGVFSKKELRKASSHWIDDPPEVSIEKLIHTFYGQKQIIHLLKIDIEGSEFDLLKKDTDWLEKILHISMEVHPEFGDVTVLSKRIEKAGFRCNLIPSWHESGIPKRYPGFLFASRISHQQA
jgi:FkbM family methyltransferase